MSVVENDDLAGDFARGEAVECLVEVVEANVSRDEFVHRKIAAKIPPALPPAALGAAAYSFRRPIRRNQPLATVIATTDAAKDAHVRRGLTWAKAASVAARVIGGQIQEQITDVVGAER